MSIHSHIISDLREEMVKLIKTVVHCFKGKSQLRFFLGRQRLVFSPHRFVFLLLLFSSVAAAETFSLTPDGGHARMQDREIMASGTYHNHLRTVSGTERPRKLRDIYGLNIKYAVITLIKGVGIGVCEAYRDNLNSHPLLVTARKHYPHGINPVYADVLAKVDDWHLLEKKVYELLYLRLDNFYHYNKQFFSRSSRQMEYFKKKLQRIWPGGGSFITEMDIDNDGTPETVLRYGNGGANSLIVVNLERQVIDEKASKNLFLLNRPMFYHRDIQALEQAANNIELLESGSEQQAKKFNACVKRIKLGARPWLEPFWLPGEWREVAYDIFVYEDQVYFTRSDLRRNLASHRNTGPRLCDRTRFFGIYTIEGDQTRQVCLYYNESTPINKQQ